MTFNTIRFILRKMNSKSEPLLVPIGVRGMKLLDREKFLRNVQVPIIKVTEQNVSKTISHCKQYFLKLENFKPVQNFDDGTYKKCIYLNPETITKWEDLSETVRQFLNSYDCTEKNFSAQEVQLCYDNWSYDAVFKAVLPVGEEIVSGYSQVGHIIHLNLREHLIEYRQLIGQVLLDKIKTCTTVVNKSNIIDNTFRNFSMEIIAGQEDYLVSVKENNCHFQFDFSKVYWNPRLGKEHERILSYLKSGDVLFDVFCGVGPFAIPAAKRKCKVFANDLNPDSFKWLNENAEKNKINKQFFKSYNQDGKDFICNIFKSYLTTLCKGEETIRNAKIHVTMNLPAMAVEFLKYFRGLLDIQYSDKFNYDIVVYVYCFATGDNPANFAKQLVNDSLGMDASAYIIDTFDVRNVSPKKEMMRITMKLCKEILFDVVTDELISEPPSKKVCVK